jgi:Darcynin, domain of unknown function
MAPANASCQKRVITRVIQSITHIWARFITLPNSGDNMKELNHVYFMLVKTTTTWLQFSVNERFKFLEETIAPILQKHPDVAMRFFDSEAFSGHYTDVLMWETSDVKGYQSLVEDLRATLFWDTYFEIIEIIPAIENAYALFNGVNPISSEAKNAA